MPAAAVAARHHMPAAATFGRGVQPGVSVRRARGKVPPAASGKLAEFREKNERGIRKGKVSMQLLESSSLDSAKRKRNTPVVPRGYKPAQPSSWARWAVSFERLLPERSKANALGATKCRLPRARGEVRWTNNQRTTRVRSTSRSRVATTQVSQRIRKGLTSVTPCQRAIYQQVRDDAQFRCPRSEEGSQ